MDLYDVGDVVRIATSPVFSVGGVATDPSTVTLTVKEPDGTETAYTYAGGGVTKAATGSYYKDVTADAAGLWAWEWVGTGNAAAAASGAFRVRVPATD